MPREWLRAMALTGVDACWLPDAGRVALRKTFEDELTAQDEQ